MGGGSEVLLGGVQGSRFGVPREEDSVVYDRVKKRAGSPGDTEACPGSRQLCRLLIFLPCPHPPEKPVFSAEPLQPQT